MRPVAALAVAVTMLSSGCHGGKAVETEAGPSQASSDHGSTAATSPSEQKRLESFAARLEAMSSAQQMLKRQPMDPARMVFGLLLDADQKVAAGPRETARFHFRTQPWTERAPGQPDGLVTMAATLDVDEARTFVMAVHLTDEKAAVGQSHLLVDAGSGASGPESVELGKIQVMIVRKKDDAASKAGRLLAAKLWGLVGESIHAAYAPAVLEGVVLGTRLKRNTSPPSFSEPGAGTWTLLRVMAPGEAYVAFDLAAGVGEIFPKAPGVRSEAGLALFKAL